MLLAKYFSSPTFLDFFLTEPLCPSENTYWPRLSSKEEEDRYIYEVEVPGFPKDKIDISLKDDVLSISGKIKRKDNQRSFARDISLPTQVDPKKVKAELKDGVLSIFIDKAIEAKPRKILIE